MDRKEWYGPWPNDIGEIVSEQLAEDRRHNVFAFAAAKGFYVTYGYELTGSDVSEGRSDSVGWLRIEGPPITGSLTTAREIAAETVKLISETK